MTFSKRLGSVALSTVVLLCGCGDDPSSGSADTDGTGTGTGESGDDEAVEESGEDDTTGVAACEASMSDYELTTLPADVVISIGSSLLTPHPVLQAAIADVESAYEEGDVRVALIAASNYEQPYATEVCNMCGLGDECLDPIAVNADVGVIEPLARFNGSKSKYSCVFRPPGASIRHYVAFTDTEPAPGELMEFEAFLAAARLQADSVFHVAFMLGCSQMEGGMGLVPVAEASGGISGNICEGVVGLRAFLEELAVPRLACGWPISDPGPNNSSDNLELVLLDGPSGGEMAMTRVADGLCSEPGAEPATFEWFVSILNDVESVRLCPAACDAVQGNWAPGEISFRESFTCPDA
ncbi:MAG: hypothetical protein JKY37_21775 [Nannocystaceae bacterium]|nr:hypothetical protein [Nannocystaceae bacterium]